MSTNNLNEQLEQFTLLWHKLLSMDKDLGLQERFPLFVELSTNEVSIINMVSKNPNIILKDICEALNLPKSTLTSMINRLENKGYINRTIARKDLRSFGLALTDKGIETQIQHKEYEEQVFSVILKNLESEERTQLLNIMNKIISINI